MSNKTPNHHNGRKQQAAFPKDTTAISEKADRELRGRVINGREYLGRGGWKCTEKCERQLRDERI